MSDAATAKPFLGITVLGDFILSEGVDAVLGNVHRAGATAVACNPTVTAAADEGTGSYQPPIDGGSSPRVFDRPLFGKHALWVSGGVSYHPNAEFYSDSPYAPRQPNHLTEAHGAIIGEFIDAAVDSGLQVYFQVGAVQPSGLRDEDRPCLPNGQVSTTRMADTGSLASPAIRAYNRAYIRDLLEAYPRVSGFRPDWPEYPCYTLDEVFHDFSPHVAAWAAEHGFDFAQIRTDVGALYKHLHGGLTNADLQTFGRLDPRTDAPATLPSRFQDLIAMWFAGAAGSQDTQLLDEYPGVLEWLRLKAALSVDILKDWRDAITAAGGADCELSANAFMFPYTLFTGFDFSAAATICQAISPKLYTMHWSLMVKFWGDVLMEQNGDLDETLVVSQLTSAMDLANNAGQRGALIEDYGYPLPSQPHPIHNDTQRRQIGRVAQLVDGQADVYPLVHGYGPEDDFQRRLQLVVDSGFRGLWINRYGYLSDAKLDAIANVWN